MNGSRLVACGSRSTIAGGAEFVEKLVSDNQTHHWPTAVESGVPLIPMPIPVA